MSEELRAPSGEFFTYRTEDGQLRLNVRFDGETVWLTQAALAELFQTTPQNITLHIRAIFEEGELEEGATCKDYLQVRQESARQVQRSLKHYNLPMMGTAKNTVEGTARFHGSDARVKPGIRKQRAKDVSTGIKGMEGMPAALGMDCFYPFHPLHPCSPFFSKPQPKRMVRAPRLGAHRQSARTLTGCEPTFTRQVHDHRSSRPLKAIDADLKACVARIQGLLREVVG